MIEGIAGIIEQLERQKAAIERALEALREVDGVAPTSSQPVADTPGNKRSEGQKARWAAKKAEAVPAAVPSRAARKRGMTPEGRKRLAEAMRKRWAVKRAASAVKKAGRKKAA